MKVVYPSDPVAAPGRMESIYNEPSGLFEFVEPEPDSEEDLELVHWRGCETGSWMSDKGVCRKSRRWKVGHK